MHDPPRLRTLAQRFTFPGATCDQLAHALATAPLVGEGSIFGNRVATSTRSDAGVRYVDGFRPAPGPLLQFDVELRQPSAEDGAQVIVEFLQPHRRRPYLAGQFVWLLSDAGDGGAVLDEHINTPTALAIVERPLHGSPLSLRRFLFFSGGHKRVMKDVANNIRSLLER